MLIVWNNGTNCFEVQFDKKFWHLDLESVKSAGFKTSGPPDWIWYTVKTKCLKYLQTNRPESGLNITTQALEKFQQLVKQEEDKQRVLKPYKEAKKKQRKAKPKPLPNPEQYEVPYLRYQPPTAPAIRCIFCLDPVYEIYEKIDPLPICIWCEKTISDNQDE